MKGGTLADRDGCWIDPTTHELGGCCEGSIPLAPRASLAVYSLPWSTRSPGSRRPAPCS